LMKTKDRFLSEKLKYNDVLHDWSIISEKFIF